jgi:hypothetical protein
MISHIQTSRLPTAQDRIATEIRRRLCSAGHWALRSIECEYCEGKVVLYGRVPSYYMKQVAQSVLLADPAVETLVNRIEVADEPS